MRLLAPHFLLALRASLESNDSLHSDPSNPVNDSSATNRFSLADLLRARRKLPVGEVIHLLDSTACAGVDHAPEISLRSLCVEVDAITSQHDWPALDVTAWPPFRLNVVPLEVSVTDIEKTRLPSASAGTTGSPLSQFASVVYELLGGRNAPFASARTPLAPLNEEANRILLEAIRARNSDVRSFWQSWTAACGFSASQETWKIPKWAPSEGSVSESIDLLPESEVIAPIRLSARSQFRIGRSRSLSDLAICSNETDPECTGNLSQISRIHVLAERNDGGITLRDGDGTKRTLNGSTFDGIPLSQSQGRTVTAGGLLKLASNFELELLLVYCPWPAQKWNIDGIGRMWSGEQTRNFSSLRFRPVRAGIAREAIWLFTVIGFTLKSPHKIHWNNQESDAYFIRRGGCFWIANAQLDPSRIRVDDAGIDHRQMVPLLPGQSLELGGSRFTVAAKSSEAST